jgi:hypothetical protein
MNIVATYNLRNKRDVWRIQLILSHIGHDALYLVASNF